MSAPVNIDPVIQAPLAIAQAMNKQAQVLSTTFPQQGGTSSTATGGAATLPANPVGFIEITLPSGAAAKVPYYS